MKTYAIRFTLFAFLVLGFSPAFAVNDSGTYPCFGVYSLGWLDAEFYWRENTTWYKLDTNDFDSTTYGQAYFCSLTAYAADASTVSQASVPVVCQPASSGDNDSCLVFQAKQWLGDSNRFYRENLGGSPTDWSIVETWLNTYAEDSLVQKVWDQKVESTGYLGFLQYFITTNHTDFQDAVSAWVPENTSWNVHSRMKDVEVRIRIYLYGIGYVWLWFDTASRTDSYKKFQVDIYKFAGDGMMAIGGDVTAESLSTAAASIDAADEASGDFYDLTALSQKATVSFGDFGDIFPKLFMTTNPEDEKDQETSSVKAEENEKGEAVALTVEWVDRDAGKKAKILLEGLTIVAVNGIMLYDLGTVEEQIAYLVTEKIESVTLAEPNKEATTYTAY